jgi:hypothetical protein
MKMVTMSESLNRRIPQRHRLAGAGGAVALAAALVAGIPGGTALGVPLPTPNHVWAGCVLSTGSGSTLPKLQADVNQGGFSTYAHGVEVAFVVVYSRSKNDGQPKGAGFTGPIICINPDLGIEATSQDAQIPAPGVATSVDTLDAEDAFILRYKLNGGANNGTIEKVICHTVADNTDCFRISPLLP